MNLIIDHLTELKKRLVTIFVFLFFSFLIGLLLSPSIIRIIIKELTVPGVTLVALTPFEFIYTQIKIGMFFGLILSSPLIIYEAINFLKPGLKKKELIAVKYILPGFFALFLAGVYFGYAVFLKVSIFFLANLSSLANIQNMWSINSFIEFIIIACLSIGIVFELPLVIILLNKLHIISYRMLKKYRMHIYILSFVLAALITPPDVVTQVIIALPIILLYEVSLVLIRYV